MQWFITQFGNGPLQGPVVLPTHDFFPPPFSGSDEDVRAAVRRVAGYMGADGSAITVASASVLTNEPSSVADPAVLLAVYMKHGLAYLGHTAPGGGLPAAAPPG